MRSAQGHGLESPHVRLTPSERDEKPITAVDFAVRRARGDKKEADETFLAIVESSTRIRARAPETKKEPLIFYLATSVADFVKNLFVGRLRAQCDNEPSIMGGVHHDTAQRATVSHNGQPG